MWIWSWTLVGSCKNKMVKKPLIIMLGGSSELAQKVQTNLVKKYQIICFYNNNIPKRIKKISYIKLNLNKKNNLKIFNKVNLNNKKIIIINFASIKIDKISLHVTMSDLKKTFEINTFSFLKILQRILPTMMKKKWGRIINISSTGGLKGEKGTLLYSSSKNATHSMIKVMSQEYAEFNITFNSLSLGNFNYGLFKKLEKKIKENILKKIPSKKTGNIKNINNAINFIINSDYVNGSLINIDGGYEPNN